MTSPRVIALDATGVTLANDPDGVAHELVLALLSDLGDNWFKQLRDARVTTLPLGPALRAEAMLEPALVPGPKRFSLEELCGLLREIATW